MTREGMNRCSCHKGIEFPDNLHKEYHEIRERFSSIVNAESTGEIIPTDFPFARKIVMFLIGMLDHILSLRDETESARWVDFLGLYNYGFFYGDNGDDHNYLSFDEFNLDRLCLHLPWRLRRVPTNEELKEFKTQLEAGLEKLR